jgi:uncharacterized membrane protein YvbJ
MIICPKCGNDNPLGRVFCGKCGSKLDFSHTSSQEMVVKVKVNWWGTHWRKIAYLVFLMVLIPVALLFWPIGLIVWLIFRPEGVSPKSP